MKAWQMINKLKVTESTKEQLEKWMHDNKLCPAELGNELELLEGCYPACLYKNAKAMCDKAGIDCDTCHGPFLDSEIEVIIDYTGTVCVNGETQEFNFEVSENATEEEIEQAAKDAL